VVVCLDALNLSRVGIDDQLVYERCRGAIKHKYRSITSVLAVNPSNVFGKCIVDGVKLYLDLEVRLVGVDIVPSLKDEPHDILGVVCGVGCLRVHSPYFIARSKPSWQSITVLECTGHLLLRGYPLVSHGLGHRSINSGSLHYKGIQQCFFYLFLK